MEKVFDAFGNELKEGDKIVYISSGRSYPHLKQGIIQKIVTWLSDKPSSFDLIVHVEGRMRASKLSTHHCKNFEKVVKI